MAPTPVQVGGASASDAPTEGSDRTPSAPELDPTEQYRRFPNERVRYGDNTARPGTPKYARFEKYRVANTIGGARRLGATSQNIGTDIANGALVRLRMRS